VQSEERPILTHPNMMEQHRPAIHDVLQSQQCQKNREPHNGCNEYENQVHRAQHCILEDHVKMFPWK